MKYIFLIISSVPYFAFSQVGKIDTVSVRVMIDRLPEFHKSVLNVEDALLIRQEIDRDGDAIYIVPVKKNIKFIEKYPPYRPIKDSLIWQYKIK